jgi:hypothetical protein
MMQEREGHERREREAAADARASRDGVTSRSSDHGHSADIHLRNAERLERHGAQHDAARERDAADHDGAAEPRTDADDEDRPVSGG